MGDSRHGARHGIRKTVAGKNEHPRNIPTMIKTTTSQNHWALPSTAHDLFNTDSIDENNVYRLYNTLQTLSIQKKCFDA
jgi:hypothetical protein